MPGFDVGRVNVQYEAVEEDGDERDDRAGPDGQPHLPAPPRPPLLAHPPLLHGRPLRLLTLKEGEGGLVEISN